MCTTVCVVSLPVVARFEIVTVNALDALLSRSVNVRDFPEPGAVASRTYRFLMEQSDSLRSRIDSDVE